MLQTPFEITGVVTPPAEEVAFYDAVAAETGRIKRWQMGTTTTGQPVWLVVIIGSGTLPTNPTPADSMLIVAKQHGNEPAPRETAMQTIRDLAYDTTPAMISYLNAHPVYVIPTVNYRTIREGASGVDLNRDHLLISQPETLAVAESIAAIDPVIIVDVHEYMGQTSPNAELAASTYEELTPTIRARGQAMLQYVGSALTSAGITWDVYDTPPNLPTTLTTMTSARHIVPMLIETMGNPPMANRIAYGIAALRAIRSYHEANLTAILADIATSKTQAAAVPRSDPFTVTQANLIYPVPQGYTIPAATYATWAPILDLLGIVSTAAGADRYVATAQAARVMIILLMDPGSLAKGFTTTPDNPPLPPPDSVSYGDATTWGPIRIDGQSCEVTEVAVQTAGELLVIWSATP